MDKIKGWAGSLNPFAVLERLLIAAALVLMAVTVGGQLGQMIGLQGKAALVVGWAVAIVYDALWIGALRMSEVAIRQRSKVGMAVMLGVSAVAIGVSVGTLLILGHAKVFAGVPVAAAVLMGLRIFADNMLADGATAKLIAEQSASARNARALASADARQLASEACTDVTIETAGHLAEMERQIARAKALTGAQKKISKARSKAEETLAEADKKYGGKAAAFTSRELLTIGSRPVVTPEGHASGDPAGHTVVTQVIAEIEGVTTEPVTPLGEAPEQVPVEGAMALAELAQIAGVDLPEPGVTLTDDELAVVLRWLRYTMEPPRSYRQAQEAFRKAGFRAREERVRRIWGEIETREAEPVPA